MASQQNQFQVPNFQFRVLIIGRANAGKTSILQRVCDTMEGPKIYRIDRSGQRSQVQLEPSIERGLHDVEDELIFEKHDGYIFHDSRGFESGSEDELRIVQDFVRRKSREKRLKDRLHAIWFCIPMDNDRPSLDLKHFGDVCPDKNVPVIALFTKYDQFKRDIKMKLEDQCDHPDMDIDAEMKSVFDQHYLANLSGPPPFICLERMHKDDQRCTDLIALTSNLLSGGVVPLMLMAVQKDNLEVSINHAIKRTKEKFEEGSGSTEVVIKLCLAAFPWMWYFVVEQEQEFQQVSAPCFLALFPYPNQS